ncbi:MAG: response regulator [Ferruginibacter sp.]
MSNETYAALIVDDSELISDRMEKQLMELDCISETYIAYNFNDAVDQLEDKSIDVVILDINLSLPGKNGLELLQFIKDTYPDIKTIMLTNQSGDFYKNLCLKIGSDHFFDKSTEFEKIPSIISSFFSNRKPNISG